MALNVGIVRQFLNPKCAYPLNLEISNDNGVVCCADKPDEGGNGDGFLTELTAIVPVTLKNVTFFRSAS